MTTVNETHGPNNSMNLSSMHPLDINNHAIVSNDDADDSDSSFEELETPRVLRNQRVNDTIRSDVYSNNHSFSTIQVPLNDKASARRIGTPKAKNSSPFKDSSIEDTLIRQQKLISDTNEFSPTKGGYLKGNLTSKMSSPSRMKMSKVNFDTVERSNRKPSQGEGDLPVFKSSVSPSRRTTKGNDDIVKRLFNPPKAYDEEFESEVDDKFSTKPQVDSVTIRTTSPKFDKSNNIASSVDMASISTGVQNSLRATHSRIDIDMPRQAPMKVNMTNNQDVSNLNMELTRESSDEHEVSLDEPEEILEELNSYNFTKSASPSSSYKHKPLFKYHKSPSARKPIMTPISKHFERVENRFTNLLNKRRAEECEEVQPPPTKKIRPSRLNEPWDNSKWDKLHRLLKEPRLSPQEIITSDLVQDQLDISEYDLGVRVNFLLEKDGLI